MVNGLGPHFLLTTSLERWHQVLQRSRISSKCFRNESLEPKAIPKNFTRGQISSLSPYSFRMGSEFLARGDLENMMIVVFSRLNFILHLAHHFANFHGSLRKSFAANCMFLLAAHSAASALSLILKCIFTIEFGCYFYMIFKRSLICRRCKFLKRLRS